MEAFSPAVIRIGGVEIDVPRECVRSGGIEYRLRHRTFEVLLYLTEHRDRVVSKEELFREIWNGTAVTEDTLVQSIVEIRKAVGDDPRDPQFVRTIPKVGYRFIGVVGPETESDAERQPAGDVAIEEPSGARRFGELPLRTVLVAVALLLAGLGIAITHWVNRKAPALPVTRTTIASTNIAVAHFESRTTTPDLDWLGDGLPTMVMTSLSREKRLALIDRGVMERFARTKGAGDSGWLDVAKRAGAQRLITGHFERRGERIRVDAQLYDVATRRLVGGSSIVSTRESLLNDVDLLSSRLAALLGADHSTARQTDLMTDNLDAYEAYSRGVAAANGLNNTEAVQQFERAVMLDPEFAMAHARIGYTYAVTWTQVDRAKPYFATALALGDHLNDRERLYVHGWQSIAEHEYARAIDYFRLIVSRYPTDIEAYGRFGRLLIAEERPKEAIDILRRGLAVDPDVPELNNTIGLAHSYLGQHAEAIAHHQRYVAALPDEPNAHDSLGLSYQRAGEYDRALAEYEEALRLNRGFEVAIAHRANTYWQLGRNREAIRGLHHYIDVAPSADERLRGFSELFLVLRALGKPDPEVNQRILQNPELYHYDVLHAIDRGDVATAVRLVESMRSDGSGRGSRVPVRILCYVRTQAALASSDQTQALEYARETLRHAPTFYLISDMEDTLGDTLAAFGRNQEAVDEYSRILRLNANRGRTRYKLARALEAIGRKAEARVEYEHFLRVWKTADADAPELVDAKRRSADSSLRSQTLATR